MAKKKQSETIKTSVLKTKSEKELLELMRKTEEELVKLKMTLKTNKLTDVHQPRQKRKEIARIKTILREKELNHE